MPFAPTVSGHARRVLELGLEWLFNTVQPAEAIVSHHGINSCPTGNRRFSFIPDAGPNVGGPVLVVHVNKPLYLGDTVSATIKGQLEMDLWQQTIEDLGFAVTRRWNGEGDSGSFALAGRAHPTLLTAVDRFHAGCLAHPEKSVFCGCGWLREGERSLVTPTWPAEDNSSMTTVYTQDEYVCMFQAGAQNAGATDRAAVYLLLAAEVDLGLLFEQGWAEKSRRPGPGCLPETVAYITDWYRVWERHGDSSAGKLLKIAQAYATNGHLNTLSEKTRGLDVPHAQALATAVLIAAGVSDWFTVEPTLLHPDKLKEA